MGCRIFGGCDGKITAWQGPVAAALTDGGSIGCGQKRRHGRFHPCREASDATCFDRVTRVEELSSGIPCSATEHTTKRRNARGWILKNVARGNNLLKSGNSADS